MERRRWRPTLTRARIPDLAGCLGLGILSVVAYCVELGRSGLGNPFYAAAVQSGAHSFHDAFFAAINFGGTMSVDKPPLSLWLMEISVRVFGLNSFGELLPDALAGMATTAVVVLMVREWTSLRWGLVAGLLSLASPMANVMFRFNNPEALLTLLTVGIVWCFSSALRSPSGWKLAGAGVLIGAAVLTKLLAGVVIVPVLVVAYAVWAPAPRMARFRHLTLLTVSAVVSAGWYFAIVAVTPAAHRPWLDGTTDNNPFSLLFTSNVGRLVGRARGPVSPAGLFRMFNHEELANYGPLIVLSLLTTLTMVLGVRLARPDVRAALLINGSAWWVCLVMSYIQGGYHSYYAVVGMPLLTAGTMLNLALIRRHPSPVMKRRLLLSVLLVSAAFDAWVWSRYSSSLVFAGAMAVVCAVGALGLMALRRPQAGLAAVLVVALALPGYYTWISWRDHHVGGSPLGGPLGAQTAWENYPPSPDHFNYPSRVTPALRSLLQHAGPYEFAVALQHDAEAASIQLATGVDVFPLTGWNRPPPGMYVQLKRLVGEREVRYFLPTGPPTGILFWVVSHFAHFQVGDQTVYDLTRSAMAPHAHMRRCRHAPTIHL